MLNINQRPKDKNGFPHGEWIHYHNNGKLAYRGNYVHGTVHALDEEYNVYGVLFHRGYWNMGIKRGYWYYNYQPNEYFLWLI